MPVSRRSLLVAAPTSPAPPTWADHVAKWKDCQACSLCRQRFRICLARGTVPCDVLFIGEAPGANEDTMGRPFVGPAGQLLDQIIENALGCFHTPDESGFPRDLTHALTNLVCCFPAEAKAEGTNEPKRAEIMACRPRLVELANIARPRLVVCVGELAHKHVESICTGSFVQIVHPAFILARLPTAQKHMAVQRCVVQVRNAWERTIEENSVFKPWEAGDASVKTKGPREQSRADYDSVLGHDRRPVQRELFGTNDDELPF